MTLFNNTVLSQFGGNISSLGGASSNAAITITAPGGLTNAGTIISTGNAPTNSIVPIFRMPAIGAPLIVDFGGTQAGSITAIQTLCGAVQCNNAAGGAATLTIGSVANVGALFPTPMAAGDSFFLRIFNNSGETMTLAGTTYTIDGVVIPNGASSLCQIVILTATTAIAYI